MEKKKGESTIFKVIVILSIVSFCAILFVGLPIVIKEINKKEYKLVSYGNQKKCMPGYDDFFYKDLDNEGNDTTHMTEKLFVPVMSRMLESWHISDCPFATKIFKQNYKNGFSDIMKGSVTVVSYKYKEERGDISGTLRVTIKNNKASKTYDVECYFMGALIDEITFKEVAS